MIRSRTLLDALPLFLILLIIRTSIGIEESRDAAVFTPYLHTPFLHQLEEEICSEPIFCSHGVELQRRINDWQNPHVLKCHSSRFLLYSPPSDQHGIGSMMQVTAAVFRYAVCLDRILFLIPRNFEEPTTKRWGGGSRCEGSVSTFECYFQSLTSCQLSEDEIMNATMTMNGKGLDAYPLRGTRIVGLQGLPAEGPCSLCGDSWDSNLRFFDGLFIGEQGFNANRKSDGSIDTSKTDLIPKEMQDLHHFSSIKSPVKLFWSSQFLRYIMRPSEWTAELLRSEAQSRLYEVKCYYEKIDTTGCDYLESSKSNSSHCCARHVDFIPRPFISMHVRYGYKYIETAAQPLGKYMNIIRRKAYNAKYIFVSTETEKVIHGLATGYPEYTFYYINYDRIEFLELPRIDSNIDYTREFAMSLTNLFVASEADYFIGSLTSSWCVLIEQLERTRGDAGSEYWSVDKGSQFTSCF